MKIPVSDLLVYYKDIGNNNAKGNNPQKIGLCEALSIENLKDMAFPDVAERIKPLLVQQVVNHALLAIKNYSLLGTEGIYNYDAIDGKNIILFQEENKFFVKDGNHRVLALILLGEKFIEIGRGNCSLEGSS